MTATHSGIKSWTIDRKRECGVSNTSTAPNRLELSNGAGRRFAADTEVEDSWTNSAVARLPSTRPAETTGRRSPSIGNASRPSSPARRTAERARLCILGAGNTNDLDLAALLSTHREVHLVDIDSESLVQRRDTAGSREPSTITSSWRRGRDSNTRHPGRPDADS